MADQAGDGGRCNSPGPSDQRVRDDVLLLPATCSPAISAGPPAQMPLLLMIGAAAVAVASGWSGPMTTPGLTGPGTASILVDGESMPAHWFTGGAYHILRAWLRGCAWLVRCAAAVYAPAAGTDYACFVEQAPSIIIQAPPASPHLP
jgi:hypothetical protein